MLGAALLRTGGAWVPQQRLYLSPEPQGQRALRGVWDGAEATDSTLSTGPAGLRDSTVSTHSTFSTVFRAFVVWVGSLVSE